MSQEMMEYFDKENHGKILFDHEQRLKNAETIQQNMIKDMSELKETVKEGNKEAIDMLKKVLDHNQNMDQMKASFKQELERHKLEMEQKQFDKEQKEAEKKAEWERAQKEENRKLVRQTVQKIIVWGAPIVTTIVTVVVQLIEKFIM